MNRGHNENAVRLAALAGDAQVALDRVAKGETDAIDGWLAYGAALNEGRSMFPSDEQFGQWVAGVCQVGTHEIDRHERAAAMWAAANRDQFDEARAAGKARTVRGIHDKWKQIEAERERERLEAERKADDARKRAEAEAARKLAEEKAKAEAEARAAVEVAKTEDARKEAEAKVVEAVEAKAEAEQIAAEAEAEIPAEVEQDPAEAKARRALAKLTTEALIDEVLGLRAENGDLRKKVADLKAEIEIHKGDLAAFRQEDMGRALGNAQRLARAAEGRMKEFQTVAVRSDRRVKVLEAEVKRLKAEIENQVIPL